MSDRKSAGHESLKVCTAGAVIFRDSCHLWYSGSFVQLRPTDRP